MKLLLVIACLAPAAFTATTAHADYFNRIASFPVAMNLPADRQDQESSAEIISVTGDGKTLVYTDSPMEAIGLVDISIPSSPKAAGTIKLEGDPTAVVVFENTAYVAIDTSRDYIKTSGQLASIDIVNRRIVQHCELSGQPDSITITDNGSRLAIAIENERDQDRDEGNLPQLPAGHVALLDVEGGNMNCDSLAAIDVTGLARVAPADPEPEYVAFNRIDELVVSLQENNHLVIIDTQTMEITASIDAGSVTLENVDTDEERALTFDSVLPDQAREPDAVHWLDNERFVSANEGDYDGGSRGFTIFSKAGEVLYESLMDFEHRVALAGHYPEHRSGNKGIEPEGLEVATFGDNTYIFVLAERASIIGVYRDTGNAPEFVQLLPTGVSPESATAITSRNLLAVANEVDLVEDSGARSYITIYEYGADKPSYPMLQSIMLDGKPLGWGALSGLAADHNQAGKLYAVNDSFYALQPRIFTIDATTQPARIVSAVDVTQDGEPAELLDVEGIVADGDGGFWLASEGRPKRDIQHALYRVNASGEIQQQIAFPKQLRAVSKHSASEGITLIDNTLWVAIQRPWKDDPDHHVKLLAYSLENKTWGSVLYPLDVPVKGWHGLSEISLGGNHVYLVERDNQIGVNARHKKLFRVALSELQPAALGAKPPIVNKEFVHDFMPDLLANHGYAIDKIEGFAIDISGTAFAVTDNDGVDDSNGETLFFHIEGLPSSD